MYIKDWLPEEGAFVVCTVKHLEQHRARVSLDEYKNLEGMVHSSEISRRWIRNLKTYLKPGKRIVCKVMDVDAKSRHINLSVRRVGESQKRTKLATLKNEKSADDLLRAVATKGKIKYEVVFENIGKPILKKYGQIYPFLQEAVVDPKIVNELKLEVRVKKVFLDVVVQRIKLPKSHIRGALTLHFDQSEGLLQIKKVVKNAKSFAKKSDSKLSITYAGAPKYNLKFESSDPKQGNKILERVLQVMEKEVVSNQGEFKFKRK